MSEVKDVAVSVVIPCYNQGQFILEAIASVESCQDDCYEIVIVNDGSTDPATVKVLTYLKEKGYRVIDQNNQGLAAARNRGIKEAKGRYILPLDADNKIDPDYITKGREILEEMPEVGVVYGNSELFGEKTGILEIPKFDINRILAGNYIDACALFRKTVWVDCGGYDSHIPQQLGYEDWDFWLGAAAKGWRFYHIPEVLFHYRFRWDSMVSGCNQPENRQELFRYICSKHIGLYATNFAHILAQKESERLQEEKNCRKLEKQQEKLEIELEIARSHLRETEAQLQARIAQVEDCEVQIEELKQPQTEGEEYEEQLEESQHQVQQLQTEIEQLHLQIAQNQADFQAQIERQTREHLSQQETQQQTFQETLQKTQNEWQTKLEEQMRSAQNQLQETGDRFERSIAQLQAQLQQAKAELDAAHMTIAAMHSSKFWKLRTQWFKLKKAFGLTKEQV